MAVSPLNPPAFPRPTSETPETPERTIGPQSGMDLLTYTAIQCLPAVIHDARLDAVAQGSLDAMSPDRISARCYDQAESLIRERQHRLILIKAESRRSAVR